MFRKCRIPYLCELPEFIAHFSFWRLRIEPTTDDDILERMVRKSATEVANPGSNVFMQWMGYLTEIEIEQTNYQIRCWLKNQIGGGYSHSQRGIA
jgi:hypothetical protein